MSKLLGWFRSIGWGMAAAMVCAGRRPTAAQHGQLPRRRGYQSLVTLRALTLRAAQVRPLSHRPTPGSCAAARGSEREAARFAAELIRARLAEFRSREPDVVMVYTLPDPWKRKLFLALCRRYGLKPYREYRQRYSTVQLRAPQTFQRNTLWPEYQALAEELGKHLQEITERVVRETIHGDMSEAAESGSPKSLPEPTRA
jgi:hypothetical protein